MPTAAPPRPSVGTPGTNDGPTPLLSQTTQPPTRMDHDGPPSLVEQGPIAPIIGVGGRFVHAEPTGPRPLPGPVQLALPIADGTFAHAHQDSPFGADRGGQGINAAKVLPQRLQHQTRGGRNENKLGARVAQAVEMLHDPLVQTGPNMVVEVLARDGLQLGDGDRGDAPQAERDESAVIESAELMLKTMIHGAEDERPP